MLKTDGFPPLFAESMSLPSSLTRYTPEFAGLPATIARSAFPFAGDQQSAFAVTPGSNSTGEEKKRSLMPSSYQTLSPAWTRAQAGLRTRSMSSIAGQALETQMGVLVSKTPFTVPWDGHI